MLRASDEKRTAEAQNLLRQKFKTTKTTVKNIDSALGLGATSLFEFNGKHYRVDKVDWKDGLELQKLMLQLQAIQNSESENLEKSSVEDLKKLEDVAVRLTQLFKKLCRPVGLIRRIFWRWSNPFIDATQQELGELMGFFFACRTRSSVKFIDRSE